MSEPLTDYVRRIWKESAEDVLEHPGDRHSAIRPVPHARERLRYEATLAQKDAQIEALVKACEAVLDWHDECLRDGCAREYAVDKVRAAIKEATNAT